MTEWEGTHAALEALLERAASRVQPPTDEQIHSAIARGRNRRLRRRTLVTVIGGLLVAGVVIPLTLLAPLGQTGPGDRTTPGTSPEVNPIVTAVIPLEQPPRGLAVGEEGVWVATSTEDRACSGLVQRIDPGTDSIVASVPVDVSPAGIAAGAGAVWIAGDRCEEGTQSGGAVVRIDPAKEEVAATVDIGAIAFDVAVGEDAVWATRDIDGRAGELVRIDPLTNKIAARIPLDGRLRNVVAGQGAVWVTDSTSTDDQGPSLIQVDPATNHVVNVIGEVAGAFVALGDGEIWGDTLVGHSSAAVRIDARTGEVEDRIPVQTVFRPFAVGYGGVWFIAGPGEEAAGEGICRLNVATNKVDMCVGVGGFAFVWLDPAALDTRTGAIWVANDGPTVTRVSLMQEGRASAET